MTSEEMVARSIRETGIVERFDRGTTPTRSLPPKVRGEHRWIAVASYVLPNGVQEGEDLHLDHENRFDVSLGCIDCEQPHTPARAAARCPAEGWADPGERR